MNQQHLAELRDYYDNNSTADNMDGGTWETDVDPNPMVTTSLRLPKDVLDWIRQQAEAQHVRPSALIRQWIEERRSKTLDLEARLTRLEQAVFDKASH